MKIGGINIFSFKDKMSPSNHRAFVYYEIALLVLLALNLGNFFYLRYQGIAPSMWLFTNPNNFFHNWEHWGLQPWDWWHANGETFFGFFGALFGCIIFFIGELLWSIIAFIGWLIVRILFYILGALLTVIMYSLPGVFAIICILFSWGYWSDSSGDVHFAFPLIYTVLFIAASVICYLFAFNVFGI